MPVRPYFLKILIRQSFQRSLVILLLWGAGSSVTAQDIEAVTKAPILTASGGITLNQIVNFRPGDTTAPNPYSLYLAGNLNFNAFGVVSIPLSFAYTNAQFSKSVSLPFNRFAIAPSYKWIKVYAGYASMQFSPYSLAGHEIFGGGVELTPNNGWRISAIAGRMKRAADSIGGQAPSFKRMGGGFKVGYHGSGFEIDANIFKATDVRSSLPGTDSLSIAPQDNLFGSVSGAVDLFKNIRLAAEYGISALNRNIEYNDGFRLLQTTGDLAVYHAIKTSLSYKLPLGTIGATYERVAPNYTTLGAYQTTNDYEHITANISAQVKMLNASLDVGYQHDNLQSQKTNTTSQLLLAGNISASIAEKWNLAANFSNVQSYVYINDIYNQVTQTNEFQNLDTLNVTQLNFSAGLNASYLLASTENARQNVNISFMYQNTAERQEFSSYSGNNIYNTSIAYQHSLIPAKLNVSAAFNYNYNQLADGNRMQSLTFNASVQKTFWEALRTGLIATYSNMRNTSSKTSNVLNLRLTAGYTFLRMHNINLSFASIYQHGQQRTPWQYSANLAYSYTFGASLSHKDGRLKLEANF